MIIDNYINYINIDNCISMSQPIQYVPNNERRSASPLKLPDDPSELSTLYTHTIRKLNAASGYDRYIVDPPMTKRGWFGFGGDSIPDVDLMKKIIRDIIYWNPNLDIDLKTQGEKQLAQLAAQRQSKLNAAGIYAAAARANAYARGLQEAYDMEPAIQRNQQGISARQSQLAMGAAFVGPEYRDFALHGSAYSDPTHAARVNYARDVYGRSDSAAYNDARWGRRGGKSKRVKHVKPVKTKRVKRVKSTRAKRSTKRRN